MQPGLNSPVPHNMSRAPLAMRGATSALPKTSAPTQYRVTSSRLSPGGTQTIHATLGPNGNAIGSVEIVPSSGQKAEIINLKVDPNHRHNGVGRMLVNAAMQASRAAGFSGARLEAYPDSPGISPSTLGSMYTSLGFRTMGRTSRGGIVLETGNSAPTVPVRTAQPPVAKMIGRAILQGKPAPVGVIQPAVRRSARIQKPGYFHRTINLINGVLARASAVDKHGTWYWTGWRTNLGFSQTTKNHFAGSKAGGCQIQGHGCTGNAVSLDHIQDFATRQSSLPTHNYCDGTYHWSGILWQDAYDDYNDVSNLQWSCTSCNSSKSGARGLYAPARYVGACPGATCAL